MTTVTSEGRTKLARSVGALTRIELTAVATSPSRDRAGILQVYMVDAAEGPKRNAVAAIAAAAGEEGVAAITTITSSDRSSG